MLVFSQLLWDFLERVITALGRSAAPSEGPESSGNWPE